MNFIIKKLVEWKGAKIMGSLVDKLKGYKTYITLGLGIIVAIVGHYFGPIKAGPVDIPLIDSGAMWQTIWAAIAGMFMRNGISNGPTPPSA